jgi:hypothetical protein
MDPDNKNRQAVASAIMKAFHSRIVHERSLMLEYVKLGFLDKEEFDFAMKRTAQFLIDAS